MLQKMKRYGIELSELLNISTSHGFGIECVEFMEYLVDQTVQVRTILLNTMQKLFMDHRILKRE